MLERTPLNYHDDHVVNLKNSNRSSQTDKFDMSMDL